MQQTIILGFGWVLMNFLDMFKDAGNDKRD